MLKALDTARIRYHLWGAERILRARDDQHLTEGQRQRRAQAITALHVYRQRGIFPRNEHPERLFSPCFIDQSSQVCAVGHLLVDSGHADLAAQVARTHNYARVREMHLPELGKWADDSGLSVAELARIQPGYPNIYPLIALVLTFIGLPLTIAVNLTGRLWWLFGPLGILFGINLAALFSPIGLELLNGIALWKAVPLMILIWSVATATTWLGISTIKAERTVELVGCLMVVPIVLLLMLGGSIPTLWTSFSGLGPFPTGPSALIRLGAALAVIAVMCAIWVMIVRGPVTRAWQRLYK